ncbi:DUF2971 domain-containing protein [Acerihabitans arboris]|uniref:DUF2971 domain-containing protein n=1 Tax=Acerihabitans arboris TaxID=2691583 RepID=A0A845SMZ4_9GAMM|nr:DUF2971 domain-containing protein [Acerihabitans arboris]NDL64326.1 DUF2971 domain-containing protein [Acerihabitans arboris]
MLYKYVGHESIEQVIEYLKCFVEKGTIFASKPITFNDPAEFKIIFSFDAEPDVVKKKYFSDHPTHTETDFKNWYNSFDEHAQWYVGYSTREIYLTQNGTICLTRDSDNYLMWSHYARSHTGFCIGFDDSIADCIEDYAVFGDVNYSQAVPGFNYFTETLENFAVAMFLHKGLPWAYEKEFRIVTDKWGIKKFDKSLIKEIVIGCRAPVQLQDYVSELIDTDIRVSKMGLSQDTYSLKKIPLKKNGYFQGDV